MTATTIYRYETDPYATGLTTRVQRQGEHAGRRFVVLADTVLFPEGGGQPADRGSIDGVPVIDVQRQDGELRHFIASRLAADIVTVHLDWARRFDLMQQHTGQHLLSAIAHDRFGWPTTAFHLGESIADVELAVPTLDQRQLAALEDAVAAEIRAARVVRARRVSASEYETLVVRTRGLPEGHAGDVRLVEIDGIDLNTCGGTHLSNTAEIETVCLLETESMRGGTRLYFVCGQRARRRLAASEARGRLLRHALGADDDTLHAAAIAKEDALREALRRERQILGALAELEAERLASLATPLVAHRFTGRDSGFLNQVAKQFCQLAPRSLLLLASGSDLEGIVLIAAGPECTVDVRAMGSSVVADLAGRGGGTERLFQAKVKNLSAWEPAVARLRSRLHESSL